MAGTSTGFKKSLEESHKSTKTNETEASSHLDQAVTTAGALKTGTIVCSIDEIAAEILYDSQNEEELVIEYDEDDEDDDEDDEEEEQEKIGRMGDIGLREVSVRPIFLENLLLYNWKTELMSQLSANLARISQRTVKRPLAQALNSAKSVVVRNDDVFSVVISTHTHILVHDFLSGQLLKKITNEELSSMCKAQLTSHNERVYVFNVGQEALYEINGDNSLVKIAFFEQPIDSLWVTKHDESSFSCVYTDFSSKRVFSCERTPSRTTIELVDLPNVPPFRVFGLFNNTYFLIALSDKFTNICVRRPDGSQSQYTMKRKVSFAHSYSNYRDTLCILRDERIAIVDTKLEQAHLIGCGEGIDEECRFIRRIISFPRDLRRTKLGGTSESQPTQSEK